MSDEAFAEYIEPYSLTNEQKEALMRCKDAICEMAAAYIPRRIYRVQHR